MANDIIKHVPEGWVFHTADFSVPARKGTKFRGSILLVRSPEQMELWYNLPEEVRESDDCPPMFISGEGYTLEEAFMNASAKALLPAYQPLQPVNHQGTSETESSAVSGQMIQGNNYKSVYPKAALRLSASGYGTCKGMSDSSKCTQLLRRVTCTVCPDWIGPNPKGAE